MLNNFSPLLLRSLAVQTTVQLTVCALVVVLCWISTAVTAFLNVRRLDNNNCNNQLTPLKNDSSDTDENRYGTFDHSVKGMSSTDADGEQGAEEDFLGRSKRQGNNPNVPLDDSSATNSTDGKHGIIFTHKVDNSINVENEIGTPEAFYRDNKLAEDRIKLDISESSSSSAKKEFLATAGNLMCK